MSGYLTCSRCGRDAPEELDGDPNGNPGPWSYAEWQTFGEELDDSDGVICPGCLTDLDYQPELDTDARRAEWDPD
jgi:hypothetical protein